jgi:hypothetical protein
MLMNLPTESTPNSSEVVLNRILEMEKLLNRLIEEKESTPKSRERNEVVITVGQMNRAENVIEEWLGQLVGNVIAELDFIDKTTFGYLDCIPKMCGIRIITSNPKEFEHCLNKVEKCSRDRPHFEIVRINKLHQRWIGSKTAFIIDIGADLKTDSLGHTTHSMKKLDPSNFAESLAHFEKLWNTSEIELKKIYGNDLTKQKIYPL